MATSTARRHRIRIALAAGGIVVAAAVAITVEANSATADSGREQVIGERGAEVMPFDLDATTHRFEPILNGGLQTVTADTPTDREQIDLIQQHLREEATAFTRGEFDDPARIHGTDMPGLTTLQANANRIDITYQSRPDGGEIRYTTNDPALVTALHNWFAAQRTDHQGHGG